MYALLLNALVNHATNFYCFDLLVILPTYPNWAVSTARGLLSDESRPGSNLNAKCLYLNIEIRNARIMFTRSFNCR